MSVFGSARTPTDHSDYALARETARRLGDAGFAIITGGGPGIMEAANRGAKEAGVTSVGLNIDLPFEQGANAYQDIELRFHYFFTRKVMFVRFASAFVVFPGGFGTLDELFEALLLIQTDKIRHFPVVLVRSSYWAGLTDWLRERLVADGMIAPSDLDLLTVTDDPDEVVARVREGARRQGIQLRGVGGDGDRRVAPAHVVDEGRHPLGQPGIGDLEDVLGVLLARARQVERADEDDVVGDRDLGVHVVVDRARRVGRRDLARPRQSGEHAREQRPLPGRVLVAAPLPEDLRDLGRVRHAGDVDDALARAPG